LKIQKQSPSPFWLAFAMLVLAALACTAEKQNLDISGLPQYICPSSTPRPTDTPFPTSLPTYPATFQANLNYNYVDVIRSTVLIQYIAQSVGPIQVSYSGIDNVGQFWPGSNGQITIGYAPSGSPGMVGAYPVVLPFNVNSAVITINGFTFGLNRFPSPYFTTPNPYPCCLAGPVYPTPVPTFTPYPTPTEYVRTNDYFLGDPVYTSGALLVRFRVTQVTGQAIAVTDRQGNPQNVYTWQLEIKNIGSVEYSAFPAAQMYISQIIAPDSSTIDGLWGASIEAAKAIGIVTNYDPVGLTPGQTQIFTLAAFGPIGTAYRLSYAMDSSQRGSGPTQVPGTNIVTWLNAVNTVCEGNIQEP
jgi:hypothetical protein